MGTFEMNRAKNSEREKFEKSDFHGDSPTNVAGVSSCKKEECIIALKVYDQCRQLHCNKKLHSFIYITLSLKEELNN